MKQMTTTDLSSMEVINLCDGGKLGCPSCFEIDCDDGKITAILIQISSGFLCFGKTEYYRIPWCKIQCIGEDTILVKMTSAELSSCCCRPGGRGHGLFG